MLKSFLKIASTFLLTTLTIIKLGAVKIEGVEVDDSHPLTQKHLPAFLERVSSGLEGVEGSYLAWSQGRRMALTRERDAAFPGGDPGQAMLARARSWEDMDRKEWNQLTRDKAKYQSYQKQIENFAQIYADMEKFRPSIVSFFKAVEKHPNAFVFPEKGSVLTGCNTFPFGRGSGYESYDFVYLQELFHPHAKVYGWADMEKCSILGKEEDLEGIQKILQIAVPSVTTEGLRTLITQAHDFFLEQHWNQDDFRNAVFIIEEVGLPLVEAARQLQEEAKAEQVDGISAT